MEETPNRRPEKIYEYNVKCPICSSGITVSVFKYTVPYYGDILIFSGSCPNCNYVYRDVDQLGGVGPRRVIYRVEQPEDVNALVIKSSYARVEIPELGLIAEPGIASQGYITTVEGLIIEFINALTSLCDYDVVSTANCQELLQKLEKARNGELKYTIIIYDYTGVSDVVSNKAMREKLEVEEKN